MNISTLFRVLSRKHLCQVAVALLCLGSVATLGLAKPNFVVIFTDDQTYRAVGYNNPHVSTPNLDELARKGVIFDHAYVATPICAASRASIMTSLYPQQHQSVALDTSGFLKHVVKEGNFKTLAHYLTEAGYTTGFCGKSHLGDPRKYGFTLGAEHKQYDDVPAFEYARQFLLDRSGDNNPFLLWLAPKQPHLPLLPEQKWIDQYADARWEVDPNFLVSPGKSSMFNQGLPGEHFYRDSNYTRNYHKLPAGPPRSKEVILQFTKAYYATISHLDWQIGELVARLKRLGLLNNTVIIFLSDNGYFLGNHGLGNKITMHEESVRVPMFIYGPNLKTAGLRSAELVSSLDVMPTILEMAAVPLPNHLMGKSLVPLLRDPNRPFREYIASECVGVGGKLGTGHRMVRGKRFKYILTGVNEEILYDQQADVYEQENLAGRASHRKTLGIMREAMRSWMEMVGDKHERPASISGK